MQAPAGSTPIIRALTLIHIGSPRRSRNSSPWRSSCCTEHTAAAKRARRSFCVAACGSAGGRGLGSVQGWRGRRRQKAQGGGAGGWAPPLPGPALAGTQCVGWCRAPVARPCRRPGGPRRPPTCAEQHNVAEQQRGLDGPPSPCRDYILDGMLHQLRQALQRAQEGAQHRLGAQGLPSPSLRLFSCWRSLALHDEHACSGVGVLFRE